jgi:hypothetical protein
MANLYINVKKLENNMVCVKIIEFKNRIDTILLSEQCIRSEWANTARKLVNKICSD